MKYLIFITLTLSLFACQKVIDVDLNDSDPQYVIVANYNASDSTVHVKTSKTSNFFSAENPSNIDNASITIYDANGIGTIIPSIGNGEYQLSNYVPNFLTTYSMVVSIDGQQFESSCYLSASVPQEDPYYEYFAQGFFGESGGNLVFFTFFDPVGLGNNYKVVVTVNDTTYNQVDEITLGDDQLTDGNLTARPALFRYFQPGDTINIELQMISKSILDYYTELQTIAGGQNGAAPANPEYYWTNKGLGYFSAYSSTKKGVLIQ